LWLARSAGTPKGSGRQLDGPVLKASRSRELQQLAHQQATYRRLSALVAEGAPPEELFSAFAEQLGGLLPGEMVALGRSGPDGLVTPVALWARRGTGDLQDAREVLLAANLRLSTDDSAQGSLGTGPPAPGDRAAPRCQALAAPVNVEGQYWGVVATCLRGQSKLPADAAECLAEFAELIATIIGNANSRAELHASRARIVAAADEARRRIERDLHDGVQQRLVSLALDLRAVQAAVPDERDELRTELARLAEGMAGLLDDLRETARGIHPAVLDSGGLGPALKALARRSAVPVELQVTADDRLAKAVEVAAYYVVSEALTNVAKHARASVARVVVEASGPELKVSVSDDGVGGASPTGGSGLIGLKDRVEALGGSLALESPPGAGTKLYAVLPLGA